MQDNPTTTRLKRSGISGLAYGGGVAADSIVAQILFGIMSRRVLEAIAGEDAAVVMGVLLVFVIAMIGGSVGGFIGGWTLPAVGRSRGRWGYAWQSAFSIGVPYGTVFYLILLLIYYLTDGNTDRIFYGCGDGLGGFTLLTANVGNADPRCLPHVVKLCRKDVEARVAKNIQALRPDIVAIQETMPPDMCDRFPIAVPGSICEEPEDVPQIRRLVGADYTIVCESRNGFECIAVQVDAGEIEDCEPGALCETDRLDRQLEGCRWNVAIMAATVRVRRHTFDVVNAHPESRSVVCRRASIHQIFEDRGKSDSLVREEDALLLGDFTLDPWREDDVSSRYWNTQVGVPGRPFIYHSGTAEQVPPYPTLRYAFFERTYDQVVSNFLEGTTRVLGESPGTTRLYGGKGMDHRAVYGRLSFKSGQSR